MNTLAIDARMIAHSGIGTALRGLLHGWLESPPPFEVVLFGPANLLEKHAPDWMHRDWQASIYGATSFLPPPDQSDCSAWLAMHYPLPLGIRIPVVAVVHDLLHLTHAPSLSHRLYATMRLRHLRARAAVVVTPSRHVKVQLQTLHRFPAHRVLTIPWGAGIAGIAQPATDNPLQRTPRTYLLAVGIWKSHKNLAWLLERLAVLHNHKQLDAPLVLAGLRPSDHQPVRELIARFALPSEQVILLDYLSDSELLAVMRDAAALVFPSLAEGFGFPLVEAIALGTPAIALNLPPMNELSDAIHLVDPDDVDAFEAALRNAIAGTLPRTNAAPRTWATASGAYAEVIDELLAQKPR